MIMENFRFYRLPGRISSQEQMAIRHANLLQHIGKELAIRYIGNGGISRTLSAGRDRSQNRCSRRRQSEFADATSDVPRHWAAASSWLLVALVLDSHDRVDYWWQKKDAYSHKTQLRYIDDDLRPPMPQQRKVRRRVSQTCLLHS